VDAPGDTTYVVERSGTAVGTVRLSVHGDRGGVYGFAVLPEEQGKGIGRDVLARCCRMLRADGRTRVTLEVETENESALGLYTSTGFVREAGEDYCRLPVRPA
jgi:ribosomal protein S18 acetylase RimI-like enzyme